VKRYGSEADQKTIPWIVFPPNQKTVAKWRKRTSVANVPTGRTVPKSTVLSVEDEAMIGAFRGHTLLALDDCLYAQQPTIPHLTRSSSHRCQQRQAIEVPLVQAHRRMHIPASGYRRRCGREKEAQTRIPHVIR